jgi:hypothetical protein
MRARARLFQASDGTRMWNVLKFTYSYAGESEIRTRIHAYLHLGEAEALFDHLRLAYQFDTPLRVKGGKRIKIASVNLYTSFREDRSEAEAEVRNGGARLIQEAHEVEIDLE